MIKTTTISILAVEGGVFTGEAPPLPEAPAE